MSRYPNKEQLRVEITQLRKDLEEMTRYRDGLAADYMEHKNIIAMMEATLTNIRSVMIKGDPIHRLIDNTLDSIRAYVKENNQK